MRRKPPKPDTRLDWRDPNMPVLRDYTMANGAKKVIVDPDYEHRYREFQMHRPGDDWRSDPTYNVRKKS